MNQKIAIIGKKPHKCMLKKKITTVIIVIALVGVLALSFTACNKNKTAAEKKSYDYSKILKGDFSDFVGYWVGNYSEFRLSEDGSFGWNEKPRDIKMESDKYYTWEITDQGWYWKMALFPVGVDVTVDGKIIKSDKTKIRLFKDFKSENSSRPDIFYMVATDAEIAAIEAALPKIYAKLLKGDFSGFTGTWVDSSGNKSQLTKFGDGWKPGGIKRRWDGRFEWSVSSPPGSDATGINIIIYPVGVEVHDDNGALVKTDKTKIRGCWYIYELPSSNNDLLYYNDDLVYYQETNNTTAPAQAAVYYYATSNLRLRSEPDTSKNNRIAGVPQGSRVELLETGSYMDKIDNISAPWFKVKTEDGTVGWLFSGYLTAEEPNK